MFPSVLCKIFLRLYHNSLLVGHPSERRGYDTMWMDSYYRHLANDVYETVGDFRSCAKTVELPTNKESFASFRATGVRCIHIVVRYQS